MAKTTSIQLQSVGDLIGESFRTCRLHFVMIFKILLPPFIGVVIARTGLVWGLIHMKDAFFNGLTIAFLGFCFLLWFYWLVFLRLLSLLNVFMLHEQDSNEDRRKSYNLAYQEIKERQLVILAIFALAIALEIIAIVTWIAAVLLVGLLLTLVVGKIAAICLSVTLAVLTIAFGISLFGQFFGVNLAMLSMEQKALGQYLQESFQLICHDLGRALGFSMLLTISIYLIAIPLSVPVTAYSIFTAIGRGLIEPASVHGWITKMPFSGLVLTEVWSGLISLITGSLTCISYGTYYKDLKVRQYATDLTRALETLIAGTN